MARKQLISPILFGLTQLWRNSKKSAPLGQTMLANNGLCVWPPPRFFLPIRLCNTLCLLQQFYFSYTIILFIGPAPEKITSKIFSETTTIKEYKIVKGVDVDLHSLGTTTFSIDGTTFEVEVIDSVADYVDLMKEIFDFNLLKEFLRNFKIVANGMNGGNFIS